MAYYLKYPPEKGHEKTTSSPHFSLGIVERGNASARENHPTQERRDAAGRENDRGQGSLKSQKVAQSLNETMRKQDCLASSQDIEMAKSVKLTLTIVFDFSWADCNSNKIYNNILKDNLN